MCITAAGWLAVVGSVQNWRKKVNASCTKRLRQSTQTPSLRPTRANVRQLPHNIRRDIVYINLCRSDLAGGRPLHIFQIWMPAEGRMNDVCALRTGGRRPYSALNYPPTERATERSAKTRAQWRDSLLAQFAQAVGRATGGLGARRSTASRLARRRGDCDGTHRRRNCPRGGVCQRNR